jgi:hypothetical protein
MRTHKRVISAVIKCSDIVEVGCEEEGEMGGIAVCVVIIAVTLDVLKGKS